MWQSANSIIIRDLLLLGMPQLWECIKTPLLILYSHFFPSSPFWSCLLSIAISSFVTLIYLIYFYPQWGANSWLFIIAMFLNSSVVISVPCTGVWCVGALVMSPTRRESINPFWLFVLEVYAWMTLGVFALGCLAEVCLACSGYMATLTTDRTIHVPAKGFVARAYNEWAVTIIVKSFGISRSPSEPSQV